LILYRKFALSWCVSFTRLRTVALGFKLKFETHGKGFEALDSFFWRMAKNVWTKSVSKALYDRISRPFKFYEIHFQVNGSDFVGITHKRAVDLLRNAGQVAVLVVERIVGRAV